MPKASLKQTLLDHVNHNDPEVQSDARPSLVEVAARRAMIADEGTYDGPIPPRSMSKTVEVAGVEYPVPEWLITEEFVDETLGPIKGGKEADVSLVERTSTDGRSQLLALKNYIPPDKRSFHQDQIYREGRKVRMSREQKALDQGTSYGRKLRAGQWSTVEFDFLRRLWAAGASVPFPVEFSSGLLMQYLGDDEQAAPRLVNARIDRDQAEDLFQQILDNMKLFVREKVVHGDLSAFNVLVWEDRAWIIDFPQAADLAINPHAMDLLERDVRNVCTYFNKYGINRDPGEEMACVLAEL